MVTITTLYPWGNPEDIDTLITKKIENQISSIEGINHIDSTSTNNFFTIVVTLENRVDANIISNKIQNTLQNSPLPTDKKEYLIEKAFQLKKFLENVGDIDTINICLCRFLPFPRRHQLC